MLLKLLVVGAALLLFRGVFILFADPLKHIPGPKVNAFFRLPYLRHLLNGTTVQNVSALHEKYGQVVRISPNEVSITSIETGWQEIYGFRTGNMKGHPNMNKDEAWHMVPKKTAPSIIAAGDEAHSRNRRVLSHAFSDKALSEQEPLIQQYVDQLILQLKDVVSASSQEVNIVQWFNWFTFDVIADLMFGEPFGCLQDRSSKYVELLTRRVALTRIQYIFTYYPFMKVIRRLEFFRRNISGEDDYTSWTHSRVTKRMEQETQRSDLMTYILRHNGDKGVSMSDLEIKSNARLMLTAGTETTASMLSSTTYLLLRNPDKLHKLQHEVRTKWQNYSDITIASVTSTPYLNAVVSEGLRYLPPVPTGFSRKVGPGGEVVAGHFIPEGTSLCISQYPAYHDEMNFKNADSFVPERWLGDEDYANDKRQGCQPFSFGPRNCLGKNLAYAEMRLVLAKFVWTFDLELEPDCLDWSDRLKVKTLWEKPELKVKLHDVHKA